MSNSVGVSLPLTDAVRLRVNWQSFITSISDVAAQGFATAFGITDGISGGISALINAIGSIKTEDDPSEKAWRLFLLSFAWSLDELRSTQSVSDRNLRKVVKEALSAAKERVAQGTEVVPLSFLQRPVTLPIYQIVRDEFVARRNEFRSGIEEGPEDLSARFDAAFSRAVSEIWLRKPEPFQSLVSLLGGPALNANSFELQWTNYRQRLIHDFEVKPMFGQEDRKIALAQAYIPLRCVWKETTTEDGEFETSHVRLGQIDEILEDWIIACEDNEEANIRLVGGGPGSGKSTTARYIARLFADKPSVRPLFIPLQHIDLEIALRDAVNNYFTSRTGGAFTQGPLSRDAIEDGPRLLLIFDGLDEIARPGEGANEVANLFISKLELLTSALQGDSEKSPRVIVTGRLPSFQAAKKFRGAVGKNALEVIGYAPYNDLDPDDHPLAAIDQRPIWWQRYAPLGGLPPELPAALQDQRLADVTSEPLLCYLLVLSGFVVDNWESAAQNRNRIYQRLVDEVWRRGWGDSGKVKDRQGPGKHLSMRSFNDLMEAIALAAWLGGDTRIATEEAFHGALKIRNADDAWKEFKGDGGEDVANLAMNFYLKGVDGSLKGFEFTHKSFGDYLAARAIIELARETANLIPRYMDAAAQTWIKGTATGTLTPEILNYIIDEVRLYDDDDNHQALAQIKYLFESFQSLAIEAIENGLPAHTQAPVNWRMAARMQKNSEVMLWAILTACVRCIQIADDKILINVGFDKNRLLLKSFLARVSIGDETQPPIVKCLCYVMADKSDLFGLEMSGTDISHGSFCGANFNGCHLMESNLSHCDLRGATFQRANLDNAVFHNANINKANFVDTRIYRCDPFSSSSGKVQISRRTLLDWPTARAFDSKRIQFSDSVRMHEDQHEWDARFIAATQIRDTINVESYTDEDIEDDEDMGGAEDIDAPVVN